MKTKRLFLEISQIEDGSYIVIRQVFMFRKIVATCPDKIALVSRLGEIATTCMQ
jgi:hypothetical protein